jgi:hypothetical protein
MTSGLHSHPVSTRRVSQIAAQNTVSTSCSEVTAPNSKNQQQQYQTLLTDLQPPISSGDLNFSAIESPTLDIFNPFFDPEMFRIFPYGDIPDLSQFETNPLIPDYFATEAWDDMPMMNTCTDGENVAVEECRENIGLE